MKKVTLQNRAGEDYVAYQFDAKLVSISDRVLENKNGTEYRVATISFKDAKGVPATCTATVYESNFAYGMEVGQSYLTTAIPTEGGRVFVQVSHLVGGSTPATLDMFEGILDEAKAEIPA